eukprot:jgi/Botrbrau1/7082/Bobra.0165s0104.1
MLSLSKAYSLHPLFRSAYHTAQALLPYELQNEDPIYEVTNPSAAFLDLRELCRYGSTPRPAQLIERARILRVEVPLRFAQKATELSNLPYGLSSYPYVQRVRQWYIEAFQRLHEVMPILDAADELLFTDLLHLLHQNHKPILRMLSVALKQLKRDLCSHGELAWHDLQDLHNAVDRLHTSHIRQRMLVGHHVALHHPPRPHYIGIVCTACSATQIAQQAARDAMEACTARYGWTPKVEVNGDPSGTFTCVPVQLHYLLHELLKNALRAVAETHPAGHAPPVCVSTEVGKTGIIIKVEDRGCGIPRSMLPHLFTYLNSSLPEAPDLDRDGGDPALQMAGYGYGLPLSRIYARFFPGDLHIASQEGYGTVATLQFRGLQDG